MINQTNPKVDLRKDFQTNVPFEPNAEEINLKCDRLITELTAIKFRINAIGNLTKCNGPAIDAEQFINKAIQRLQHQKR